MDSQKPTFINYSYGHSKLANLENPNLSKTDIWLIFPYNQF